MLIQSLRVWTLSSVDVVIAVLTGRLDHICIFRSQIRYLPFWIAFDLGIGETVDFLLKFPNGNMFFDFFWVFDGQLLKVPLHMHFFSFAKSIIQCSISILIRRSIRIEEKLVK